MASVFPTIYSTLSPSALAALVSTQYGLIDTVCQLLVRGVGDTYLVSSKDNRFVLRVYRSSHRTLSQIEVELELLLLSKKSGVSVSYPIADLSGTLIQPLDAAEGKRYAVLFSYAPGTVVSKLSERQLQSLGRQMARFHEVSSTIKLSDARWTYDLETTMFEPLQRLKPAFSENPADYDWWVKAAHHVEKELGQLDTAHFTMGYCQYDFLPKNFHFEEDAVTLFDFDFLGYGWLINDIMTFWTHLCLDVHFNRMSQTEADQAYTTFVQTYQENRLISKEELQTVPYLSLGWWCFYMGFHATHDQFAPLVQPAQLKMRTALIRQLAEKYVDV